MPPQPPKYDLRIMVEMSRLGPDEVILALVLYYLAKRDLDIRVKFDLATANPEDSTEWASCERVLLRIPEGGFENSPLHRALKIGKLREAYLAPFLGDMQMLATGSAVRMTLSSMHDEVQRLSYAVTKQQGEQFEAFRKAAKDYARFVYRLVKTRLAPSPDLKTI